MDNHKHRQRKDSLNEDVYILSGKLFCGYCGYPMVAETGTSKTGAVHRYYKCSGKKKKITKCDKHNVRKDTIEDFVFEKTKKYVLEPNVIDSIAEVVVNRFNSELSNNAVLTKLQEELKEKNKAIDSILNAMEKGIITNSTQERLMKLENEKAILEDKVEYEQNHQIKPLEKEQIVNFLKGYARKQFDNKTDKNEFFNNFILKVLLYDDKITIVYNTSLNPAGEIYSRPNDNDDNNGNSDNGTTIYKKEIEISDADNKKLPFEFKRQLFGGELGIRTPGCFHINGFQDRRFRPLSQLSILFSFFVCRGRKQVSSVARQVSMALTNVHRTLPPLKPTLHDIWFFYVHLKITFFKFALLFYLLLYFKKAKICKHCFQVRF